MKVEDFTLQRDDDGTEFLTFDEGLTKTRPVWTKRQKPTNYPQNVCHKP